MTHISLPQLSEELRAQAVAADELVARKPLKEAGGFRQLAIRFLPGGVLPEHANPGEAQIFVVHGNLRFIDASKNVTHVLNAGDLFTVPDSRHSVESDVESMLFLSFAAPAASE